MSTPPPSYHGAWVAASALAGVGVAYAAGRTLGYAPSWYGPELPSWNAAHWNKDAEYVINELQADPALICTAQALIGKAQRKVRMVRFFSPKEKKLMGVVKYGSDCEGPPRCVHGGCTAATSNLIAIDLASHVLDAKVMSSSSVNVDYLMKIPLGSQLEFECVTVENTPAKFEARVSFHKLKKPTEIFAIVRVTFDLTSRAVRYSSHSKL